MTDSPADPLVPSRGRRPGAAPTASTPAVRRRMQATGRRDTAPELALRRELHRRGLRYLVEITLPQLPRRRMDIVFTRAKLVVLVDGCFWHGCLQHRSTARINADYWDAKLRANWARDRDTDVRLAAAGWTPLRVWEHELAPSAADRVEATLRGLRADMPPPAQWQDGTSSGVSSVLCCAALRARFRRVGLSRA